jgi:hypothetical protein
MAFLIEDGAVCDCSPVDRGGKLVANKERLSDFKEKKGAKHGDAVRHAQGMAKKASEGGKLHVVPGLTVLAAIDPSRAKSYDVVVDVAAAMAADVAEHEDVATVKTLLARTDDEVRAAHTKTVQAVQLTYETKENGKTFPVGSWLVADSETESHLETDEEFRKTHVMEEQPAKVSKKKAVK